MQCWRGQADLSQAALLGLVLGLALVVGGPAAPAGAQGVPIRVVLSYVVGVSTWGPPNATGLAEIVADEGEVRLTAAGLPELSGEHYRLWIVNTTSGSRLSLGAFKAAASGAAKMDLVRPPFDDRGWDWLLVSVETDGSDPREPSARRSIAGHVPPPPAAVALAQPANTASEAPSAPAASTGREWPPLVAPALLAAALAGLAGFGLGRVAGRNRSR